MRNLPTRRLSMQRVIRPTSLRQNVGYMGMHHVAIICQNLERSMHFYQDVLGLEINPERPHDKLPYRGEWLWIGPEMIHLMELPNPDPMDGRPEHGGRCVASKY